MSITRKPPDSGVIRHSAGDATRRVFELRRRPQGGYLPGRNPTSYPIPRLGVGEQALDESDAGLDTRLLDAWNEERRKPGPLVTVSGLVAAEGILGGGRKVSEEAIRVARIERGRCGRPLLYCQPVPSEAPAWRRDDGAVTDSNGVYEPSDLGRSRPALQLLDHRISPCRVVQCNLDVPYFARCPCSFEIG